MSLALVSNMIMEIATNSPEKVAILYDRASDGWSNETLDNSQLYQGQ